MRRVLMIAFHFPPLAGSSGIQRTLRFVQHLPHYGWEPIVLTASALAYERTANDLLSELPAGLAVHRALAFNSARHFSIRGRYPGWLARPDRWASWMLFAVPLGLRLVKRYRPQVLWSTYPIATAHVIGRALAAATGLPWVADFRDPMAQDGYPSDPLTWRAFDRIERAAVTRAAASVFVSRGAAAMYRARYPAAAEKVRVIENGFDEGSFVEMPTPRDSLVPGFVTLLHSGVVYPSERDPTQFFSALASLRNNGLIPNLRVRFRAAEHEDFLRGLAQRFGILDLIELLPPLPYRDALAEMQRADGLLLLQASNCNQQIPAKAYEYLRSGRPILGLTDPKGDTADLLRRCGVRHLAPLDDAAAIEAALPVFLEDMPRAKPDPRAVQACSRQERTRELAALLDKLASAGVRV
jgi:glycosyltransferase involved in cell wall biosynthesis